MPMVKYLGVETYSYILMSLHPVAQTSVKHIPVRKWVKKKRALCVVVVSQWILTLKLIKYAKFKGESQFLLFLVTAQKGPSAV